VTVALPVHERQPQDGPGQAAVSEQLLGRHLARPVGSPGAGLSARLTYLLKRALVDLEDMHAEHLAPVGVSGRELGVLLLMDGHSPESQQQVAGRLGVDRTTMAGLLDELEAKGLVARHADAGDRRRNVVELTGDGRPGRRWRIGARRSSGGLGAGRDRPDPANSPVVLFRRIRRLCRPSSSGSPSAPTSVSQAQS
jgi:DNA-binding MarR family transcriptional regulator